MNPDASAVRQGCDRAPIPPEPPMPERPIPSLRRLRPALLLVLLLLTLPMAGSAQDAVPLRSVPLNSGSLDAVPLDSRGRPVYAPGEVLVQLQPGLTPASIGAPANALAWGSSPLDTGSRPLHAGPHGALHRLHLAPGTNVEAALAALRADPAVQSASPNYYNYPLLVPADTFYSQQWALNNSGQYTGGTYPTHDGQTPSHMNGAIPGDDIDAQRAWDVPTSGASTGSGMIVAVIDTGVDYTHPDLATQMWNGLLPNGSPAALCPGPPTTPPSPPSPPSGPPSQHGGCDITDGTNDPAPTVFTGESSHGTHVAGIIAAANQNGANNSGIVGIAFNAKIMALQVLQDDPTMADPLHPGQRIPDPNYGATDADIISAISYAAQNGATVINMSLGRPGTEDLVMTTAIQGAIMAGVVLVAAAGNSNADNDISSNALWPANYAAVPTTAAGFISVAASDQADQRASFSDYGLNSVSIAAPGVNIGSSVNLSNDPTCTSPPCVGWAYESGTSQASPTVAGVVALLRGAFPALTPTEVKQRILDTGDALPVGPATLPCFVASNKRVNAYNALALPPNTVVPASCTPPPPPSTSSSSSKTGCLVTWLTEDWLPRRALDPLRQVRGFLWQRGEWGRELVRGYYRESGRIIAWLEAARAAAQAGVRTAVI